MKKHASRRFHVAAVLILFFSVSFLLPASRTGDARLYLLAAAVPGCMLLLLFLPSGVLALDRPSLAAALCLCGLGILAPAAVLPENALSQGMRCLAALFFLMAGTVLVRLFRPSLPVAVGSSVCSFVLLACPFLFPGLDFSMSEGGTILLLLSVSAFLSVRARLPALIVSMSGLLILLLQEDLPSAAIWSITCILVFWAGSGSGLWSGIAFLGIGALFGLWSVLNPSMLAPSALSSSFPLSGFPVLPPEEISEVSEVTDSLFVLIGKQYGFIFLLCAFLLLLFLLLRGTSIALHTRKSFHASLALGVILLIGTRALCFLLSLNRLVPFPAVAFPFLTDSLPDLFAQFFLLGILSAVSAQNESDLSEDIHLSMITH